MQRETKNAVLSLWFVLQLMKFRRIVFRGYHQQSGGAEGNRAPDLYNAIVALSQLSYGPLKTSFCSVLSTNYRLIAYLAITIFQGLFGVKCITR